MNGVPAEAVPAERGRERGQGERMARQLHAIVNPTSGNGRAGRRWPALARQLRTLGIDLYEHLTRGPGDAAIIAARLLSDGVDEIVVVGGDGTLNETVNGLFAVPGSHAARGPGRAAAGDPEPFCVGTVVSILPCGTGRDFSRSLGIRDLDHALAVLMHEEPVALDVGRISYQAGAARRERYFLNVADVGLGAEAAAYINRGSKALGGFLAYLVGAARTMLVFQGKVAHVVVDGEVVHDGPMAMVVLANGRFHAGGMDLAPLASLTDGQFDVLILRDVPKRTLLGSLLPSVYRGKHVEHPAVRYLRGRQVEIDGDGALLFEADGEQPGTTGLNALVLPGALRVRVPRVSSRPHAEFDGASALPLPSARAGRPR